jgi:hypothetical protein
VENIVSFAATGIGMVSSLAGGAAAAVRELATAFT